MQQQPSEFVLEKKIGSGSFGDVFAGHLRSTGEKIAVKRVKKKVLYQYGDYLIKAFWKEINSMKVCNCENSVRLIQNLETQNNFNIVMELCDTDLLCHLNLCAVPFSVDEVRDTFIQLNNVFKIMYKNKIVHRDLKLGNILLKYTDKAHKKFIPKLSDYGFSKDLNDSAFTATHLGTPATMAPEIMMNQQYNEKSDLWSIGAMMYQLHFKEIPYPGNQKTPSQYEKISDFDLGYNYNTKEKDSFYCYIAKDNKTGKTVLVKSYKEEMMNKNSQLFGEEIALFKSFKGNQSVLPLINMVTENNRFNLIFEYDKNDNNESLMNYLKKNEIREKHIKKFNHILYNDVFIFTECNFLPFLFISCHNFLINKEFKPKIIDFGLHKLLIPKDEYNSYFLPESTEMKMISQNLIKTNVMNYGITLLKLFSGNNLNYKGKEIILPENKIMSEDFNIFMSKCLARNNRKRFTWLQLGSLNFVLDNNTELSNIVGNEALIDEKKLKQIFEFLDNKFDLIINYYNNINLKDNSEFISQIEIFTNVTLFEMKIVNDFFNRDIYKKPFTSQNEISFVSINSECEMKKFDLNMTNPILRDMLLIKMHNNEIIKDFLIKLQEKIKKMENLSKTIQSFTKESSCSRDITNFIQQVINSVYNNEKSGMRNYFINVNNQATKEKNNELKYNEHLIVKYIIDLMIFVITIINDNTKKIEFNKDTLLQKFYQVFGEEKNKVEMSSVNAKEIKQNYLVISFLPVLFKCSEANFIKKMKLSQDKQSIHKLVKYYPSLMKKIDELKKIKNKK